MHLNQLRRLCIFMHRIPCKLTGGNNYEKVSLFYIRMLYAGCNGFCSECNLDSGG